MSKLVLCVAAYNEADMLPYSIGSVYDEVDKIILVEGAVEGRFDTPHSTDDTIDVAKSLDIDGKMTIVQRDGYYKSLEEQKDEFTKYMEPGDFFIINDADEVYYPGDLTRLRKLIAYRPDIVSWIPIFLEFYGDLHHIMRPKPGVVNLTNARCERYDPGDTWKAHHPTLIDSLGRDKTLDPYYSDKRVVVPDFYICHLSWCKDRESLVEKHKYYNIRFDGNPEGLAKSRAEAKVEEAGKDLLYYDGPLPKVLESHPLDRDTLGKDYPNYRSTVEYYDTTTIPLVYNIEWVTYPKASVVIAAYRNPELLDDVLDAWEKQLYHDYEVIVVDDGSPKDMCLESIVRKHSACGAQFMYLYNDTGDSYCIGSARNLGIWYATGERIIFTDADCIPSPNFIMEHMLKASRNNITIGPRYRIKEYNGNIPDDYIVDPRVDGAFRTIADGTCHDPWESVWGCNFSVPRNHLISINGFDEIAFDGKWGSEDVDLAYRLIRKGLQVKPVIDALVYHIEHPTRNTGGQRDTLNKLMNTNIVRGVPASWK